MAFRRTVNITGLSTSDPLPGTPSEIDFTPGAAGGGGPVIGPVPSLTFQADVPSSITDGATLADGIVTSAWSTALSVTGTPRTATDSVSGGKCVRTRTADKLRTSAGAASFLASGECTIQMAWRYRTNGTSTRPVLLDATNGGAEKGLQVLAGDTVDSIFYGRNLAIRQWDGSSWFDSDSSPGATSIGCFFPQRWNVVTIRVTSTRLDIRVNASRVWAGGIAITKPYLNDATVGEFRIGGSASDYKAVVLYNSWLSDNVVDSTEAALSSRYSVPLTQTLAGDPTLLIGAAGSATFPFISRLPNGKLYATVYLGIDGPTATDSNVSFKSSDNGVTWTSAFTETANTDPFRYSSLSTSEPFSDGSIMQVTFTYNSSNKTGKRIIWRRSTDSAVTWSAWVEVNPGVDPDEAFVTAAPAEDPTQLGHIHVPVQTFESPGDAHGQLWDYVTTNAGVTWTRTLMRSGMTDSKSYAEHGFSFSSTVGEIRVLIRDATVNGTTPMLQMRSADHGATWAAPVATNLPCWSSGQQVRILASGREVWIGRQTGSSNKAALFWRAAGSAWNATWNSSKIEVDPLWGGMYYAGIYEVTPGRLLLIHARSAAGSGHSNNIAVLFIDEWMLDFAMPGTALPATATGLAAATQQITVTGAGDFTFAVTTNNTGGSVNSAGLYTYGATPGIDTVTVTDLNSKTVATCAFTVAGGGGGFAVTSIRPDSGTAAGGKAVTITGTGFTSSTGATIGGVAITSFSVVNSTTITGVTGAHAAADLMDVVVTNGGTATLTGGYTYIPSGATLDLDADTLVLSNGANVTTWTDASGNGNTAAPPSFSPTFANPGINGKRAVAFIAAEDMSFASFTAGLTAMDLFIIAQNDDDGATTGAPMAFTDDATGNFIPLSANRQLYDDTGSTTRQATGFAPAAGGWSSPWLYNAIATASEWTARFNGTQVFTQASNTFGYGTKSVGKGGTQPYAGKVARVLIYPSKLSAPNRTIVETYLKRKFGIP